jgi:hypothetical protein
MSGAQSKTNPSARVEELRSQGKNVRVIDDRGLGGKAVDALSRDEVLAMYDDVADFSDRIRAACRAMLPVAGPTPAVRFNRMMKERTVDAGVVAAAEPILGLDHERASSVCQVMWNWPNIWAQRGTICTGVGVDTFDSYNVLGRAVMAGKPSTVPLAENYGDLLEAAMSGEKDIVQRGRELIETKK